MTVEGTPPGPRKTPADRTKAQAARELRLALLLVLAGAGLLFLTGGREWATGTLAAQPPLPSTRPAVTGGAVVGGLSGLAVLGLAGLAAIAATKGRGRALVGALLAAAGVVAVVVVARAVAAGAPEALGTAQADGSFTVWPYLAALAGLLLTAGGLIITVRGQGWAALSSRYDAPAARAQRPPPRPEVAAWDALDRGQDPTQDPTEDAPGAAPDPQPGHRPEPEHDPAEPGRDSPA